MTILQSLLNQKTLNITHNKSESLTGTISLPTSEPSSPQLRYDIVSGNFPTFDVSIESQGRFDAALFAAGKNSSGNSATLYYKVYKNGNYTTPTVSGSSSSISSNYFWTLNILDAALANVVNGDYFEIALWATQAIDYRWIGHAILPTRFKLEKDNTVCVNGLVTCDKKPLFTSVIGSSAYPSISNTYYPNGDMLAYFYGGTYPTTEKKINALVVNTTYGNHRRLYGDIVSNSSTISSSATVCPYWRSEHLPDTIKWNPTTFQVI